MNENGFYKTPPNSSDAEQAIIGSLYNAMIDPEQVEEILKVLVPEDFYNTKRQKLFSYIKSLERIDDVIIRQHILDNNQEPDKLLLEYEKCRNLDYYDSLNIMTYVEIVKDKSNRRKALRNFNSFIADLDNERISVSDTFEKAEMFIDHINSNNNKKARILENLDDFLLREKSKTPYIIEGILPESGFTTIAGFTGMGKSSLMVQMILSILANRPFLNKFQILKSEVRILYINLENSEWTVDRLVKAQLQEFNLTPSQRKRLFIPNCMAMSLDNRDDFRLIENWIMDNQIEVVIIDPILDAFIGDQNDLTVVRGLIKKLRQLNSNISWVLLHHFNKGNEEIDIIRLMLGSVGFANVMTTIMGLRRMSKNTNPRIKTIEFGKTRDYAKPDPINVDMDQKTRVFYTIESRGGVKPVDTNIVANILTDFGQMSYMKLIEKVQELSQVSVSYSKTLVGKAIQNHEIIENNGMYSPAPKPLIPNYLTQTKMSI